MGWYPLCVIMQAVCAHTGRRSRNMPSCSARRAYAWKSTPQKAKSLSSCTRLGNAPFFRSACSAPSARGSHGNMVACRLQKCQGGEDQRVGRHACKLTMLVTRSCACSCSMSAGVWGWLPHRRLGNTS